MGWAPLLMTEHPDLKKCGSHNRLPPDMIGPFRYWKDEAAIRVASKTLTMLIDSR